MLMQKRFFIVGNWKMSPETMHEARALFLSVKKAARMSRARIIVCPPFPFLSLLAQDAKTGKVLLGAQNVSNETGIAHTGEVSGAMLSSLGVHYVIVGHSERRAQGETDAIVSAKVRAAIEEKITPIICVGERARDDHALYFDELSRQIKGSLAGLSRKDAEKIIIAYEPVWAIGEAATGSDTPEGTEEMALFVRKTLADMFGEKMAHTIPILYGGSVSEKNAKDFLARGGVQGLLVGRASQAAKSFSAIISLAAAI
mgnify:FL=1